MKRLLTAFAAVVAWTTAAFADGYSLYLEPTVGNVYEWTLVSLSKLTFSNGNVVVTATDGTEKAVPISGIKRLFFSTPEFQSIGRTEKQNGVAWDGSCLYTNVQGGAVATVYRADGVLVVKSVVEADGTVCLAALHKGLYVVCINGNSYKVFKP